MHDYQRELVDLMVSADVLTFGDFTTKSGRKTPYFINTGRFRTGEQLAKLCGYYAAAIQQQLSEPFDVLFGPAYKGIPLAAGTAIALYQNHGRSVGYAFNRKETKDHGEGGTFVGQVPRDGDRILIIEDVTTAGTAIREVVPQLRAQADVRLAGLVVAVDRQERGRGSTSALQELSEEFSMPTLAIVTLDDIVDHLARDREGKPALDETTLQRIAAYRREYGAP